VTRNPLAPTPFAAIVTPLGFAIASGLAVRFDVFDWLAVVPPAFATSANAVDDDCTSGAEERSAVENVEPVRSFATTLPWESVILNPPDSATTCTSFAALTVTIACEFTSVGTTTNPCDSNWKELDADHSPDPCSRTIRLG
jgi:hypothetical protein